MRNWRSILVVALLLLLSVAIPALATEDRHLIGSIEPSGKVVVKVRFERRGGELVRIYRIRLVDIPVACEGGTPTSLEEIDAGMSVPNDYPHRDRFGLGSSLQNNGEVLRAWSFRGRMVAPRRAEGVVRVHGSEVPLEDGGTDACDSGPLPWAVRSPAGS